MQQGYRRKLISGKSNARETQTTPRTRRNINAPHSSSQCCGQNDNNQDNSQDDEQATGFGARIFLISAGTAELDVGTPSVLCHTFDVLADNIQLPALLTDDVSDIPEQLVQLADTLLDVADLVFAFDDKRLLEVHVVLVRKSRLLQLLLLLQLMTLCTRRFGTFFERSTGSGGGCPLLFQRTTLDRLEFVERSLEL